MNDLISRATAIDIAKRLIIPSDDYHQHNQAVNDYCAELMQLPSVKKRTGKWIWQTLSRYMCSECGRMTDVDECMEKPMYIFCPYCGVRMTEVKDETD